MLEALKIILVNYFKGEEWNATYEIGKEYRDYIKWNKIKGDK